MGRWGLEKIAWAPSKMFTFSAAFRGETAQYDCVVFSSGGEKSVADDPQIFHFRQTLRLTGLLQHKVGGLGKLNCTLVVFLPVLRV
jgi:hypothetical protein